MLFAALYIHTPRKNLNSERREKEVGRADKIKIRATIIAETKIGKRGMRGDMLRD